MIRNTPSSWGSLSRAFHWGLGLAIIGMIAFGWWVNHIPARPDRFFYRSIHADIGYLVLLLTVLRLVWRGINPTPALPQDTPRWQRIAARVSHWALYAVNDPGGDAGLGAFRRARPKLFRAGSDCFTSRKSPRPTRPPLSL